jgi:hypothetical protein
VFGVSGTGDSVLWAAAAHLGCGGFEVQYLVPLSGIGRAVRAVPAARRPSSLESHLNE